MHVVADGAFEGGEGAADVERGGRLVGGEQWSQQPALELAVEDRDSDALRGEHVTVAAREPVDEPVQAQATQVVAHLTAAVVVAEQTGDVPAKALVAEAGDGVDERAEGTGQSHGAWIPEAQGSGSLALPCVGLVDALEERRADGTALAGTFDQAGGG